MVVNALGPPPPVRRRAGARARHPRRRTGRQPPARGAPGHAGHRRHRRPGHRGRWPLRRRLDDGARARSGRRGRARRAGARGGRDRSRPPDGGRARAGCAGRVDRFDLAHRRRGRHEPDRGGEPARGQLARHGALAVDDGQAGAAAAHRVDGRVGARRHARAAADAAPGNRLRRGGAPGQPRPEQGADRVPGGTDRREHELRSGPSATSSSTWSRSGSRPPSGSSPSSTPE